MAEAKYEAIKRSKVAQFLDVTPGVETPTWVRIGRGVADASTSYNANVTTETFIHEDSASNSVDGYAPQLPITQYAYKGDKVFEFIDGLRRKRATGSACETRLLEVYIYDTTDDTTYAAELNNVVIQVDTFGGAGGGRSQIGYNILYNGDPEEGTATITAGSPIFTKA